MTAINIVVAIPHYPSHRTSRKEVDGDVEVGVPAGGRDTGKQGPQPGEKALSSSTVGLGDWAWQLPGGR